MKIIILEQLRASTSHLNVASTKEEMLKEKGGSKYANSMITERPNISLKRPSPWQLKGQNPVPITHTVEKIPNMGINCPRNTESQLWCLKTM